MKALKVCGWIFLAVSMSHCLAGIVSGEFQYPSMKAFWLTVISAGGLVLSLGCFLALALAKRTAGKR